MTDIWDEADRERALARTFTRRGLLVGLGQAAVFAGIGARLYQLQVVERGRYVPLADQNRLDVQILAPVRGRIVDSTGLVLADNEEGFRVILTPALAGDLTSVLRRLSHILPMSTEKRQQLAVRARRQSRNAPLVIASDVTFEQLAEINLLAPELPGVRTEITWKRRYCEGETMGHVVGYIGAVVKGELDADDDPVLRVPGMRTGKTGIELALEKELRGKPGTERTEVDARGRTMRALAREEPQPGRDARLTIDTRLQRKVLARLARERQAAVVALDVETGAVKVMASVPTFDPTDLAAGLSSRTWRRLVTIASRPMLNRAVSGVYPPGSTFKMITALAALHANVVTPKEHMACGGAFEFAGKTFRCWSRSGHGSVDLHRAIRESCDVYFYEIARRAGIDAIADMARHLGLGRTYPTEIALQKAGVIPDPDWKRQTLAKQWLGGETILAGIGQGYVAATPLQLAVMTARVATGRMVMPTLLQPEPDAAHEEFKSLGLEPAWLDVVRAGMAAVVNEDGGTGRGARLEDDRVRLAGKTGTSQVNRASSDRVQSEIDWAQRDHALFVAYFPYDKPRYAVAAIVEHGGGGGATAAPLVREIAETILAHDAERQSEVPPPQLPSAAPPKREG